MSIIIKNVAIENDLDEHFDFEHFDGKFKLPRKGRQRITLTVQDTDRHIETQIDIDGHIVEQRQRPMMEYERLQYDPEFARLEALARGLKEKLMEKEHELMQLKQQRGVPVEAGQQDRLLVVPPEFVGSLNFALSEAGLALDEIDKDIFKVTTDLDGADDDDEYPDFVICRGHAFHEHDPIQMADYGLEFQCPECGNTIRK